MNLCFYLFFLLIFGLLLPVVLVIFIAMRSVLAAGLIAAALTFCVLDVFCPKFRKWWREY